MQARSKSKVYAKTRKEESMKYYVTYRITHPEHTPTTATGTVEARTQHDLELGLERGVGKWKKQGYSVEIVKVACFEHLQGIAHE